MGDGRTDFGFDAWDLVDFILVLLDGCEVELVELSIGETKGLEGRRLPGADCAVPTVGIWGTS